MITPEEVEHLKPRTNSTLGGSEFSIYFCSDLDDNILEVKFLMSADDTTFLSIISPDKLYQYEQLLKKEHKYRVLEEVQDVVSFAKGIRETLFFRKLY